MRFTPNQNLHSPSVAARTIIVIHFALGLGLILFAAVAFFNASEKLYFDYMIEETFQFVPIFVAIGGVAASHFLYNAKVGSIGIEASLSQKLSELQTASIVRWALIEAPGLLAFVFLLLTGNLLYAIIGGALILYFFSIRPTRLSIAETLKLGREERVKLEEKPQS